MFQMLRLAISLRTAAIAIAVFSPPAIAVEPVVDLPMNRDPEIGIARVVRTLPKGAIKLWLAALERPDADTAQQGGGDHRTAQERGMPGLKIAIPALLRELNRADQHPAVKLAVALALVVLDARESARTLMRQLDDSDPQLRELVEPALARWDYKPARAMWLARLAQPPPHNRSHLRAVEAMAAVREKKAIPKLRELVMSATEPPSYRLAAARRSAVLRPTGSEDDANSLIGDSSSRATTSQLLAATLLRHHQGEAAVRLLQSLAADPEPAVASVALARLIELDPNLVVPMIAKVVASPDAQVRALGVTVLQRQPSPSHIRLLADRLSDAHPDVRDQARRAMRELSMKSDLRRVVAEQAARILADSDWRGQEQAIYLLAQLGEKSADPRFIDLLASNRGEVAVASAWGLRVLAVPESLPVALDFVNLRRRRAPKGGDQADQPAIQSGAIDAQLSQLIQFFAIAKYRRAEATLLRIVPRGQSLAVGETRAAAAWALGKFHVGDAEESVASLLEKPLIPVPSTTPDDARVRRAAAIALGLMKSKRSLKVIRAAGSPVPTTDPVANACNWAVAQITGEPLAPPESSRRNRRTGS